MNKQSERLAVAEEPIPGRQLLIASTGGHLAQLAKWAPRIGAASDSLWVTFDSAQSRSLLRDRRVLYVPYVAPRDWRTALKAFKLLTRTIDWKSEDFTSAVTTGAAVGLPSLIAARLHRVPCFYFESVSRVQGPSLTGRMVAVDPWIRTSCQYEHWANSRWKYRGSLFDSYAVEQRTHVPQPKLFVTVGTIRPYRFDALVDAVLSSGLADERTVWQLGVTTRSGLPGHAVPELRQDEFERAAREADVVITHSGVGTLMELLDLGVYPVVVPRRAERAEHIDDHQTQVAGVLAARGIASVSEVASLSASTIRDASGFKINRGGVGQL